MAKLSQTKLRARDAKRDVWKEALEAVREIKRGKVGRVQKLKIPDAAAARTNTGLTQGAFAKLLGVSVRTLQDWEQGRREPSGAAKSLIAIAQKRPEVLLELVTKPRKAA